MRSAHTSADALVRRARAGAAAPSRAPPPFRTYASASRADAAAAARRRAPPRRTHASASRPEGAGSVRARRARWRRSGRPSGPSRATSAVPSCSVQPADARNWRKSLAVVRPTHALTWARARRLASGPASHRVGEWLEFPAVVPRGAVPGALNRADPERPAPAGRTSRGAASPLPCVRARRAPAA